MNIKLYARNGKLVASLNTTKAPDHLFETCTIEKDVLEQSQGQIRITCELPILDMHGSWSPDMFRPRMQLDWRINFSCAAHRNFPYLTFFNQKHQNRGTFGTTNLLDDSVVKASMNQQDGTYEIEITVAVRAETEEFKFFCDQTSRHWPEIMADYRRLVRPDWQPAYPDGAWDPVYCTWYAVHAAVESQWLEEQVKAAAEMGFGTFIVDDGWCFEENKRVTPQTITNWYENIGDWRVSEELPGLKEHIERAQKLGLKYLLWVSPFMVGTESEFRSETDCNYLTEEHEGYRIFDPADESAAAKSMHSLVQLVDNYGLDGLKIDFVDAVPQSVQKPRGREVYNYMTRLLNELKKKNPQVLFEFRQRYTTPLMLDLGTQFRAGDVPFDFIENLHRIAQIRICVGDRVPVHADPVYWHPEESEINVARHMICAIAAVPMVSMDLKKLPQQQRQIVEFWLSFYELHKDTFKHGHWQVKYDFDRVAHITVEHLAEKLVFLCDKKYVQEACGNFTGKLQILNLCPQELYLENSNALDHYGKQLAAGDSIPVAGIGISDV